jgi:hypothetical protein
MKELGCDEGFAFCVLRFFFVIRSVSVLPSKSECMKDFFFLIQFVIFFVMKGFYFHKPAKMKLEQNTATVVGTVVQTVANILKNYIATVIFKWSQ